MRGRQFTHFRDQVNMSSLCRRAFGCCLSLLCGAPVQVWAGEHITIQDSRDDEALRRTDPDCDGLIDPADHQLPDILSYSLGTWRPTNPQQNLFAGSWSPTGEFLRFDMVLKGIANPPGPAGCCGDGEFAPFRYGPNPVQGFVEFDLDEDVDTGGELDFPELRYLGNSSRYGGLPSLAAIRDRAAWDAGAFDGDLTTAPLVERSGEDFHLEIVHWNMLPASIERSDTSDWIFSSGETWVIPGYFFQRAHGYRRFSSGCCRAGSPVGSYEPLVNVRFAHVPGPDHTIVSLVYPLTNAASSQARGDSSTEPVDVMYTNQNSIREALLELKASAMFATSEDRLEPEFALISAWEYKNPDDYLDPANWRVTALLGGSYASAEPATPFVWSDIVPNVSLGDFDGNGIANSADVQMFDAFVLANDGAGTLDADGIQNGSIELMDFGPNFSLYDLNYDGLINDEDRGMASGTPMYAKADFDHDLDVDQCDFGHLQVCFTGPVFGPPIPGCRNADLDRDGDVDGDDLAEFIACVSGPAVPADPQCGRPSQGI